MLRIQRALLAELLFIFALITVVITASVFMGVTLQMLHGGGGAMGGRLLLKLLPNLLPLALSYSIPFSWLAAMALTLGRWAADHEFVAVKAAGVHLRVLVVPVVAVGAVLAVGGMYFNSFHVPRANREIRAALKDFLPQFFASLKEADRSVTFVSGRISFDHWDPADEAFVAVELDRRDHHGRLSEKFIMERLGLQRIEDQDNQAGLKLDIQKSFLITVPDGTPHVGARDNTPFVMGHVERIGASTLFNQFFGAIRFLHRPRDMTMPELIYGVERGGVARGSMRELLIALHGRLALGAASFFLGFYALAVMLLVPPTGRRIRDFMLCFIPAVILFFPLHIAGPSVARSTAAPPWLAMWSPNLLLLAIGCALLWKAFRR